MEKAPSFLRNGGTGCLLLPSKILQNQTDAFQATWLSGVSLKRVIQLADYRFVLFQDALCPAFVALFAKTPPRPNQDKVEFSAPKFNRDGLRKGIITVSPTDRTWIPLSDILAATRAKKAPSLWKRRLWGTQRDQKFLDLLESLPPLSELVGTPEEGKHWMKGQGLQPYYDSRAAISSSYPKPLRNPWSLQTPFRTADQEVQMFVFKMDCITFGERLKGIGASAENLRRSPHGDLFKAPMVLVSHGFGKVAFCNFDVLFQHSFQSISGPEEDTDLLMFLAAYLRSNLAKYFLFHTSANWGSERDKVHLFELLRIPFPLPGNEFVSNDSQRIVSEAARKMRKIQGNLENTISQYGMGNKGEILIKGRRVQVSGQWLEERKAQVDALQEELEPLIQRYFGLTEQEITLVEDTIRVFIPSSTPRWSEKTVSLEPPERSNVPPYANEGLGAYADALTKTLNSWAEMESSTYRVCAEGGTDDQTGLAMVTLELASAETAYGKRSLSRRLADIIAQLQRDIGDNRRTLGYNRDLVIFDGKQVHIVRPNILLNWTRTAALNDAARIYGDIALAAEGR